MVKVLNPKNTHKNIMVKKAIPLIIQQRNFLEELLRSSPEKADYTEQPAAYLEGEPEEFKKRISYLCLRGLREGILQFMQEARIMQPSEVFGEYFAMFSYQRSIETSIQKRLLKDPVIRKYLAWNNTQGVFEANCENVALGVASNYINKMRKRELII